MSFLNRVMKDKKKYKKPEEKKTVKNTANAVKNMISFIISTDILISELNNDAVFKLYERLRDAYDITNSVRLMSDDIEKQTADAIVKYKKVVKNARGL